jgi:hypothetical protein
LKHSKTNSSTQNTQKGSKNWNQTGFVLFFQTTLRL